MPCSAKGHTHTHIHMLRVIADGYPRDEMIYKWRKNSVEAADQKSWRLYQFDFMGLRNTTDIIQTAAGRSCLLFHFHFVLFVLNVSIDTQKSLTAPCPSFLYSSLWGDDTDVFTCTQATMWWWPCTLTWVEEWATSPSRLTSPASSPWSSPGYPSGSKKTLRQPERL